MTGTFFDDLLRADRKLELDYEQALLEAPASHAAVRQTAAAYLERYAAFNNISREAAIATYTTTIRRYANDIRALMKTGLYRLQIDSAPASLGRSDYDLFLMLTILVTKHRCALMAELADIPGNGRSLVIGVGCGIDLNFMGAPSEADAFDLYINAFAREAFPRWRFREELYQPAAGRTYDTIYAIELLEHLDQPYELLSDCRDSLAPGRPVVTIAANVPQFDHRYNFVSDEEFEQRAGALGLVVAHKRSVPHAYARTEISARNAFYIFSRTN
jgi:hypothetical protein